MRWYRIIRNDQTVDDPLVTDDDDLAGVDPDVLDCGRPVAGWSPHAVLRAVNPFNDGVPDDALQNHLGLPVFSLRLRQALEVIDVGGIQ